MTVINSHESLIEKVGGIEKAREIVEGAPESNFPVKWGLSSKTYFRQVGYFVEQWFKGKWQTRYSDSNWVDLETLSTAIAQHEQGSNSSEFKVGDLVVLIQFANDFAREHDALYDLFDFENDLETLAVLSDRKGGEVRSSTQHLRHATLAEFKAGRRLDHSVDVTDTVTDIRNHISPRTIVWDLASGEDWSVNHV